MNVKSNQLSLHRLFQILLKSASIGASSGSESTSLLQPLIYSDAASPYPSHFEVASYEYNQSDNRANISRSHLQPIAGAPANGKAEAPPVVPKGGPSGSIQSTPNSPRSKCFTNVLLVVSILAFVGVAVIIALFLIYFSEPTKFGSKTIKFENTQGFSSSSHSEQSRFLKRFACAQPVIIHQSYPENPCLKIFQKH